MGNPLLEAGKLDRWVTIQRDTPTKNAENEDIPGWADHASRWASVKPAPGTERFRDAETAAEAPIRFGFRWEQDLVTVKDRILHDDGRLYGIAAVLEIGRREGLEVLAVARGE